MTAGDGTPSDPGSGARAAAGASLCSSCRQVRLVRSPRGSTFLLCKRSASDARYPKYPPQPVVACPGWER